MDCDIVCNILMFRVAIRLSIYFSYHRIRMHWVLQLLWCPITHILWNLMFHIYIHIWIWTYVLIFFCFLFQIYILNFINGLLFKNGIICIRKSFALYFINIFSINLLGCWIILINPSIYFLGNRRSNLLWNIVDNLEGNCFLLSLYQFGWTESSNILLRLCFKSYLLGVGMNGWHLGMKILSRSFIMKWYWHFLNTWVPNLFSIDDDILWWQTGNGHSWCQNWHLDVGELKPISISNITVAANKTDPTFRVIVRMSRFCVYDWRKLRVTVVRRIHIIARPLFLSYFWFQLLLFVFKNSWCWLASTSIFALPIICLLHPLIWSHVI